MNRVTIGLVGCGTIGTALAVEIHKRFKHQAHLTTLFDQDTERSQELSQRLKGTQVATSLQALTRSCNLIVEAASPEAVKQLLPLAIRKRRAVLVMSTGGLLAHQRLVEQAIAKSVPILLPSGALLGLDGIKSASVGKLRSVTLTTRKPPSAFSGVPAAQRKGVVLERIKKPKLLYQGSATGAATQFPKNANVAATLALAGVGPTRTRVRIIADPTVTTNVHEVEAEGEFGRCLIRTENQASRTNPKTSALAILSAVATLRQWLVSLKVGT